MRLVEQHLMRKGDPRYGIIDQAAFASKNLYNQATYHFRQAFIHEGTYLSYTEVFHRVKYLDCYQALPRKVSNSILILIDKNWKAFRKSLKEWKQHPEKYTGKLVPSGLPLEIETQVEWEVIDQMRIIPRGSCYMVEVVYQQAETQADVDKHVAAALDLGVNVLAAVTSTKRGFTPLLINGRPLKSINQVYNKRRAHLQAQLAKAPTKRFTSRQLDRITMKRNRRIDAYLHTASRRLIDHLVQEGIGTLVIGKNRYWKQEVAMGKKNNQSFVQIPHTRFIQMLTYKAQLVGIAVQVTEESYTSKASFLDLDEIPTYSPEQRGTHQFSGKRSGRCYRAKSGQRIHADINGSYNTLRKVIPTAFELGIEGFAVIPRQLAV
jgi:putative transposase